MNPAQLSYELRKGKSPDLTRRRWIIGLSLLGTAMMTVTWYTICGVVAALVYRLLAPKTSAAIK